MTQQINLYQAQFRVDKKSFSAKTMLHATAVIFSLLVAIAGFYGWKISELQRQSAAIERQYQAALQQKAAAEQKITLGHADPELAKKVQQTESFLNNQQQLRALLQGDFFNDNQGYSRYLAALARQHVAGLWLTDITLTGAGRGLTLKGQAIVPELLPNYLQNLSKEALLQGMQFQVFQLNRVVDKKRPKSAGTLEFLVATSEAAGVNP